MIALRVLGIEGQVVIEDVGRPGYAHLGVPRAGALDTDALRLGNRLVGNSEDQAGLEILLGGVRIAVEGSVRVALTGGWLPMAVDGRAVPWGAAVSVPDGSVIEIGHSPGALRAWLSIAGGVAVEPVLGSRSTDTLTGLGPPVVHAGDVLAIGSSRRAGISLQETETLAPVAIRGTAYLDLMLGPRDDWFEPAAVSVLAETEYRVSPSSSRVALRLTGTPLPRRIARELPSEGLVTGAVQVPGDGQPLVFLADHPTTGGYPVVAVVGQRALSTCAQLRPGDTVRFRVRRG